MHWEFHLLKGEDLANLTSSQSSFIHIESNSLSTLKAFDDGSNPIEHIVNFRTQMFLYNMPNTLMSHTFSIILQGLAREWYARQKSISVPLIVDSMCPSQDKHINSTWHAPWNERPRNIWCAPLGVRISMTSSALPHDEYLRNVWFISLRVSILTTPDILLLSEHPKNIQCTSLEVSISIAPSVHLRLSIQEILDGPLLGWASQQHPTCPP